MKLSSCALPSSLSPVIRMTYLLLAAARSALALTSAWRMRSAWSMSSQKTMVLAKRSVALRNSVILRGDELRCAFRGSRLRSKSRLVVVAVLDQLAVLVASCPFSGRQPSRSLSRSMRTTLYGARKPSSMPCLQRVGVDRVAEVLDVRDVLGFLRRGGQADLRGRREVVEDLAPGGVVGGAAAMALVDDDQVEEVGRELLVDVLLFLGAGDGLVERRGRSRRPCRPCGW